jgi:hypothetical protein
MIDRDRLHQLQDAFIEKHLKEADLIECNKINGQVQRAIYFSPMYKADEQARLFFQALMKYEDELL